MTEKRFINDIDDGQLIDTKGELSTINYSDKVDFYELWEFLNKLADENGQLQQENKKLKLQNGELLYQIGEVGYNNKSCKNCKCFITDIHYCWMWDMKVEPNEIVVKCDKRQERKE